MYVAPERPEPEPTVEQLIEKYASRYAVSADVMRTVVSCETAGTFDPTIQSKHIFPNGQRERSWGLAQINERWHPNVTRQQATDPEFALDFLARHLSEGKGHLWTCYRIHYET